MKKTKNQLITEIYRNQRSLSRKRNHPQPSYSNKELKKWLFSQPLFHKLYDDWVKSNHNKNSRPSLDRKDDYKPYSFINMRLVTLRENLEKAYNDRKNGINNKGSKAVIQYTLNGEKINEFYSLREAERQTGIRQTKISDVCNKPKNKTGGFEWKFKTEAELC